MTLVEESMDMRVPIEYAFEAITDTRRAHDWNPNVPPLTDIPYPLQVGTEYSYTVAVMGKKMRLNFRITRFEPPFIGEMEVSGDQRGVIRTLCKDMGGFTRVTQVVDFVPPGGFLGAMAGGLVKGKVQQELVRTLTRQRDVLEGEVSGSHGSGTGG